MAELLQIAVFVVFGLIFLLCVHELRQQVQRERLISDVLIKKLMEVGFDVEVDRDTDPVEVSIQEDVFSENVREYLVRPSVDSPI